MRWFITGTDTEVGKSVVTACLAQAFRAHGTTIAAKPVASGVPDGEVGEDAALLAHGAGHPPTCLVSLVPPVSPHRALLDEAQTIRPADLERWIGELQADFVLVEGVGGWRVPIQVGEHPIAVTDLARWTQGPVVVVARDRLGVLNHTLLTVEAVRRDGFEVVGVVLNQFDSEDSPPANLEDLRMLLDVPVVVLPNLDPTDPHARQSAGEVLVAGLASPGTARATVHDQRAHTTEEPS